MTNESGKADLEMPVHAAHEPTTIALFANHRPGLEVAGFLAGRAPHDQVRALYLTGEQPENDERIVQALGIGRERVFVGADVLKNEEHVEWFKRQQFDAVICVYWPWLLAEEVFSAVATTVNFHPALLPINRGWFPHVHSLIDGSATGVTLHRIEKGADTGAVWAQREVKILPTDTAKDIYDRLQVDIVDLFKDRWEDIECGKIAPSPQDERLAVYHSKKEIEELDRIDRNATYVAADLINRLRARTFGNRGFAYYEEDGEKIFLQIRLSRSSKME
ncbi:MAG: hypothetical protein IPK07_07585 [Deltaproteobacteria bacterium]|nr:hypothetical protein [Deltaproteobacteria bacterium]